MTGVIGIIQARLASSRLPAKILAPIAEQPLLAVLTGRLRGCRVEERWLATTRERDDDVTAAWGETLGLRVHRGDREDVLSRFTAIIRERQPGWIVRVTADDPFVDAALVDALVEALPDAEKRASLVGLGGEEPSFPLGYGADLARAADLLACESEIPEDQPYHRSHVLSWLRARRGPWSAPLPSGWPSRPSWRWTVDTPLDLEMARAAFSLFGERWTEIGYPEMVAELDARPDIVAINQRVRQKPLVEG
jgi:spore coat polysaccharide biosynthesis protein SpsF